MVVPPAHQSSSPRFDTMCCIKGGVFFQWGDVPVDSEAPVVALSISRPDPPAQTFGGAHRGRVCVCAFIGVGVCTCCERLRL